MSPLIAEPGRRRATLDTAREIERRGFAGIAVSSSCACARIGDRAHSIATAPDRAGFSADDDSGLPATPLPQTPTRRWPLSPDQRRQIAAGPPGAVRLVASGVCFAALLFFSTRRIGTQIHPAQRGGRRELMGIAPACGAPQP